ncbi:MAG: hypothetical protein HUU38_05725 [Anaerolineales bacterium]|nr:hypothetical protein [Anaerolineales bacterium]
MFKKHLSTLLIISFLLALTACATQPEERYPDASIPTLTAAEADWYAAGITYYRIVTEIHFADERRLHTVTVKDQIILEKMVAYWDADLENWGEPKPMTEEEAYWYTVPGLFETVRGALLKECRAFTRNELSGTPIFPRVIILGPAQLDGETIDDTVSWVEVREFTPLGEDEG